jgi:hypothetical protein
MKKLNQKQIIGLAALTVGALVIGKIARDVKRICQMANEKEDLLSDVDEEIEVTEADAEDVIEVCAEDAPAEETDAVCTDTVTE